jgi:hypothetical protein
MKEKRTMGKALSGVKAIHRPFAINGKSSI